jgi:hypothetical protein
MQYTDRRGNRRRLTPEQAIYLNTANRPQGFERGWGGLDATLTVRLLADRGLINLTPAGGRTPWKVEGLTALGRQVLDNWTAKETAR